MIGRMAIGFVCLFSCASTVCAETAALEDSVALIPQPVSLRPREGRFRFDADTRFVAAGPARAEATQWVEALGVAMGRQIELLEDASEDSKVVRLALDQLDVAAERAMFVGDRVDTDVVGASRLGMKTVLFTPGGKVPREWDCADHLIRRLTEIPAIVGARSM